MMARKRLFQQPDRVRKNPNQQHRQFKTKFAFSISIGDFLPQVLDCQRSDTVAKKPLPARDACTEMTYWLVPNSLSSASLSLPNVDPGPFFRRAFTSRATITVDVSPTNHN